MASGGGNLDGPNLYFRVLDELHEWTTAKNQATYTVLSQGGALRKQPLLLMITTAGWDQDTLCYRLYEHGKQVEEHPELDPTFFFCWWEAPDGADYRSREAWEAANPAAGVTVTYERYLEDLNDPEMTEAVARRYRLNQWTDTEDVWLPRPWSEHRAQQPFTVQPSVAGRRVVAAMDASTRYDSTAITWWEATQRCGVAGEGAVSRLGTTHQSRHRAGSRGLVGAVHCGEGASVRAALRHGS